MNKTNRLSVLVNCVRTTAFSLLLFAMASSMALGQKSSSQWTSDEIRNILKQRVDVDKQCVCIVVGYISENGNEIVGYGSLGQGKSTDLPDAKTVLEIGSVTKVFTTLLLADMVEKGEVFLDDPASKYLPKTVTLPKQDGREITLLDLATHTSGLPRMPNNLKPADGLNPYADYSVEQLYQYLSKSKLTNPIGKKVDYSNLGMGLLGHILALKSGSDYETLVSERIAKPLGMKDTVIALNAERKKRLALPHDEQRDEVKNWDIPTLAGAGALRSTVSDMIRFVEANMGKTKSSLAKAMKMQAETRHRMDTPGLSIALGWHKLDVKGGEIVWHNGQTGGYHSFIGFDQKQKVGVVVLTNTAVDIDDIGLHLLDKSIPLRKIKPKKERKTLQVDSKLLDSYVGNYELIPTFVIAITKENGKLMLQATGQPKFELFAESETKFFLKVVDAQITFEKDAAGKVSGLILHQNGLDQRGKRREK